MLDVEKRLRELGSTLVGSQFVFAGFAYKISGVDMRTNDAWLLEPGRNMPFSVGMTRYDLSLGRATVLSRGVSWVAR